MKTTSVILAIFMISAIHAQDLVVRCGNDEVVRDDRTDQIRSYPRSILEIPVVFHVVWNQEVENISDNLLFSQLEVLNEDYAAGNADIDRVPQEFKKLIGSADISFCLATTGPLGNPASGIIRHKTSVVNIASQSQVVNGTRVIMSRAAGGSNPWDPSRYLNIWIGARNDGLLGDATFPNAENQIVGDGVVVSYRAVGRFENDDFRFNLGRTLTHEIGHYLNLYHLSGSESGCFTDDDLVEDTPTQFDEYFGACEGPVSSCNSRDMDMNFMNFRDDACLIFFTKGQVERMRESLFRHRYKLITSNICSSNRPIPDDPLKIATIYTYEDRVDVSLVTLVNREYYLTLSDVTGRTVWVQRDNPSHLYQLDSSSLPSGIYILSLQLDDMRWARKVFVP